MPSMPHLNVLQCVPLIISITAMSAHHVIQAVLHVPTPHKLPAQLVITLKITIGTLTENATTPALLIPI